MFGRSKAVMAMLVKFSTGFGHLLMQDVPAVALLRLGGHSGTVPSAILAADLPAFLDRLRTGLEQHGDELSPPPPPRGPGEDADEPRERPVRLRLRAVPFLELVETAIARQSDLLWEKG
jgi:Domain of unknown function (DUF1840)